MPSVTVTMKSYPEHDLGNDGEEGVTTEINKQLQCDIRDYTCFAWAGGTCPRFAWAGGTFFPVVLLCLFLVLVGNRFWLYILLCTWSTIQLWCCVSFFVVCLVGAQSLL